MSVVRVVFDTNVFVRSLINPFGLWGRLVFAHGDSYTLIVSQPLVREALEVLRRPELSRKYRTVESRQLETILGILGMAEAVDLADIPRVCRDPKDDMFLATAKAAGANYLISEDVDLLTLQAYEGIRIVDAATFLGTLEGAEDPVTSP